MDHALFLSEATLIEISVYIYPFCCLGDRGQNEVDGRLLQHII